MLSRSLAVMRNLPLHWNARPSDKCHVFLMGTPRSGTTLLQKILLQHSLIDGPDEETGFFLRRRYDHFSLNSVPDEAVRSLVSQSASKVEIFDRLAAYFTGSGTGRFFIEKTAEHSLRLRYLLQMFPRSKFLFIYRDGRDAFVSARNYRGRDKRMTDGYPALWRDCMKQLSANAGHPNLISLRYEDFCENPEAEMQRIMVHLGLEQEDHLLQPSSYSATPVAADENFKRLKEPISSSSVGVHRDEKYHDDVVMFERIAARELEKFGYIA